MTHKLSLILALVLFCLLSPISLFAHDFSAVNGDGVTIYYNKLSDTACEVTFYGTDKFSHTYSGDISIPSTVTFAGLTFSVTGIDNYAFRDCTALTSISLPNSVTYIGDDSFNSCESLTKIEIPANLQHIGDNAFMGCYKLVIETLTLPSSINSIGVGAFSGCNIKSIYITNVGESLNICDAFMWYEWTLGPDWLDYGHFVFSNETYSSCILYVPTGTKSTFQNALEWREFANIKEIVASGNCGSGRQGDNLTWTLTDDGELTISGSGKMRDYSQSEDAPWKSYSNVVKSLILPNGLTNIGQFAFRDFNVISVVIPSTVTRIEAFAFAYCKNLEYINIPSSVEIISFYAFRWCTSLKSIEFPSSVTTIWGWAFQGCTSLTSVEIPSSVTDLDGDVFVNCSALTSIVVAADNPIFDSRDNCNAIIKTATNELVVGCQTTVIPSSVTSISGEAFYGCTCLTSIEIPSSVTSISGYAFYGCENLSSITITSVDDSENILSAFSTDWPAFLDDIYSSCILYVPAGTKSAFQNATGWKNFVNIEEYGVEPDTDISEYENILYMPSTEVRRGRQSTLEIHLKNSALITAFAFDLHLPAGFSVAKNAKGKDMIMLFEDRKADDHTLTSNILTDGTIAVACLSLSSEPFDGNDGAILSITVDIEEDMELGNYPIMIDNMEMTSPNNAKYNVEKCVSTVTVTSYIPGDVNDDEKITISDAVGIVNFVVRANTEGLNEKAADANEDGSISISDAVFVINQVVRKDQSPVRNIEEDRKDAFLEMNSSYQTDEQFICIPVILQSEAFCITATELTLTLPAGVSLENITSENDHMTVYNVSEDGTVRIATLSLSNESYHGDGQAAFCLNLNISNDFTFGEIIISDVELVNNQLESIHPAARSSLLYHNNSVGIDSVSDDIHSTYGFDLFGRMNKSNSNGFKLYESKKNYMINK